MVDGKDLDELTLVTVDDPAFFVNYPGMNAGASYLR